MTGDLDFARIRERLRSHAPTILQERARVLEADAEREAPPRDVAQSLAAVAAILREGDRGPEIFLIRRSEREGDPWSGHMAFPGGRREPSDRDLLETARRETREEVGLDLGGAELLGPIDDIEAVARGRRTGLIIRPFVFACECREEPRPNDEVAETLWIPVRALLSGQHDTTLPYRYEGRAITLPAYDWEGRVIWGLTYRMLRTLFRLVAPHA